jgi:CheY-like chemotaxis protein
MESLGTLAGGIAHDFNNILQAILGYCDIASANLNRDSGTLANCLDEIQSGAKRAVDLVVQILAFSRKNDVTVEPVKLESIVADSMKFLRSSIPSRIEIEIELSPETRFVEANETQIHQIVTNLCMNSLHSMEESSEPCLSVSLETLSIQTPLDTFACTLAKGDYTRLSVSDTGSGIEPNNIHRIADPFFTTKGPGKGTGLGLATVLGISTKMGGGMVVESELGIGTKVDVIFPLISIDLADATTTPKDETSSLGGTGHLLLVDDEKVLTDMYRLALKECGFTCDLFNDPREALKLTPAKVASYDFAIFDYTMPYMTGIELAQEFYAFALDLPIILVTGLLDYSEFENMRSPNVVEIVNKPFQIAELIGQFHKFRNAESNQSLQRRWK